MTTPDQTPDTELEAQELTDESLDEVQGSTGSPSVVYSAYTDQLTNAGGNVGDD
jgi:hypothetical protein